MSAYVGSSKNLKDLKDNSHPFEDYPLAGSAAILCTGGPDVIRKEAWPFYITFSGVRLCWELGEPKRPKGPEVGLAPLGGVIGFCPVENSTVT